MHPSRKLLRGGDDDEESFEALLREQANFASEKEPAAFAVRAKRPPAAGTKLGASEDGDHGKEPIGKPRPASLFKQLRQGLAAGAGAATMAGRPFGAPAAAPHPEISALPELEGPDKEDLPCLAQTVSERTGYSPKAVVPPGAEEIFPSPGAGFPVANHRAVGKSLGRQFSSSSRSKGREEDFDDEAEPENEEEAIDLENRRTLAKASPEEVQEWQQQLLQALGSDTCEFLRRRGQEKEKSKKRVDAVKTVQSDEHAVTSSEEAALPKARVLGMELFSSPGPAGDPAEALQALSGGCLDRAELQKLQWTTPAGKPDFEKVVTDASLPPEPAGKVVALLRFDFEGRVCLREDEENAEDGTQQGLTGSEGLHHHGVESSQAGYTLAELLLLSRSSSAPQRSLALATLACVLQQGLVPASQDALAADPALCLAGCLKAPATSSLDDLDDLPKLSSKPLRAGFGMGLAVFFWHGVARGDIPKHLAEALRDNVLSVQMAALSGVAALLDGDATGKKPGDIVRTEPALVAPGPVATLEAILGRPWDAARSLVWPRAPPGCTWALARRARVAVLTTEGHGGSGGGVATWPQLMRRRLLGAKHEPEVTAAEVLEPLLPLPEKRYDEEEEEEEETLEAPAANLAVVIAARSSAAAAFTSEDPAALALLARVLGSCCTWSCQLCQKVLTGISSHRQQWLRAAAGPQRGEDEAECLLQLEALRLLRRSCEVGGRAAAAWWLAPGEMPESLDALEQRNPEQGTWTAVAAVRRAVLSVVASKSNSSGDGKAGGGDVTPALCAIEGVRIWLAWLRSGAGCDNLESFMSSVGTFWQRLSQEPFLGSRAETRVMLAALLIELALELMRARASTGAPEDALEPLTLAAGAGHAAAATAACSAEALAAALAAHCGPESAAPLQLCLAALADLLEFSVTAALQSPSVQSSSGPMVPARTLLAAQAQHGTTLPEVATEEATRDEEAPWPLGGAAQGARLQGLARLKALGSLCRLATQLRDRELLPWVEGVRANAVQAVESLAPSLPLPSNVEALVGAVEKDPWPALLADAYSACRACGACSGTLQLGSALALTGSWPTAKALLGCAGFRIDAGGEDAMVRAAFRPEAPWTPVAGDKRSRAARASGQAPMTTLSQTLAAPEARGPPSLSFAAAPFWALLSAPPRASALKLMEALSRPEAKELSLGAPPWMPFLAFVSLLSVPLGFDASCQDSDGDIDSRYWAWKDTQFRDLLKGYTEVHLSGQDPSAWIASAGDWLGEALRGICDRLARIFIEESFGDTLVASTLWAFAAPVMPVECRAVCWGKDDPAVLVLLSRSLLREDDGPCRKLLWTQRVYSEGSEDLNILRPASETLGVTAATAAAGLRSWPEQLLAHQLALHESLPSELAGNTVVLDSLE